MSRRGRASSPWHHHLPAKHHASRVVHSHDSRRRPGRFAFPLRRHQVYDFPVGREERNTVITARNRAHVGDDFDTNPVPFTRTDDPQWPWPCCKLGGGGHREMENGGWETVGVARPVAVDSPVLLPSFWSLEGRIRWGMQYGRCVVRVALLIFPWCRASAPLMPIPVPVEDAMCADKRENNKIF